jgi:hypothetical protein
MATEDRGSVVLYPKGTCAQIRAARALFEEKNRVEYVALGLWRLGFPADERHWRPRLRKAGRQLDRTVPLVTRLIDRFDGDSESETVHDHGAREFAKTDDIVLSRLKGRTSVDNLPILLRVLVQVRTGAFEDFEAPRSRDEDGNVRRPADETVVIGALDLANAGPHAVVEKRLNLIELLPPGLGQVSAAMSMGNFVSAANAPAEEIARVREDTNNARAIALNLYEAGRWIYGGGAFGLRLAAWIARKVPEALLANMILVMFRLRQVPGAILPSDNIPELVKQAREVCVSSKRHEWCWAQRSRFSKILHPKQIKLAFADEITLKRWRRELNAIINQEAAKPPMGSNDDCQEVGKGH